MKKTFVLAIVLIFSLSSLNAEEPRYTNDSFARLSFITGSTYIQRASDLSYEEGVVNMPVTEGDRLGTTDGRAEIYLGRGNYVRLDHNTKIDFFKLPDRRSDLVQLQIWSGNVYFNLRSLEREKSVEIHTPDISLYILDEGLYRIDVRENGETEIFVFDGLIEASGEKGSVLVKREQRLEAIDGYIPSRPSSFYAVAEDSFDRWCEYRDSQVRKRLARRYLPGELDDFEYELAAYGSWVYMPPYGYVWMPGGVDPYWRPYYHGRWVWLSMCGWTWLPYEPWGWVTFHFGRWHWSTGLGWYWIPRTVWSPAWVSWYWGHDYFGWAPLSYYNRPVVIINNRFYDRYDSTYYPRNSRALTVIHKNQLKARNVSKVALSREALDDVGNIKLTNQMRSIKPVTGKIAVDSLGGKKVFLRKDGSSVEFKEGKNLTGTPSRKSIDSARIVGRSGTSSKSTGERIIIQRKIGYPSSWGDKDKKYSDSKKSDSAMSRIYKYITGDKTSSSSKSSEKSSSSSVKRSASQDKSSSGKTSKKSVSRSSSKRSSSKATQKSSSSRSSGSKSKKVKKKK